MNSIPTLITLQAFVLELAEYRYIDRKKIMFENAFFLVSETIMQKEFEKFQ